MVEIGLVNATIVRVPRDGVLEKSGQKLSSKKLFKPLDNHGEM